MYKPDLQEHNEPVKTLNLSLKVILMYNQSLNVCCELFEQRTKCLEHVLKEVDWWQMTEECFGFEVLY